MNKTYEIFKDQNDLKIAELIQQRRLQMLIHSCLYYEMDTNLISDRTWDMWAKELRQLQADYPEISRQVGWYEAFKDWDASTGAFLPLKDEWVVNKARQVAGIRTIKKPKKVEKQKAPEQLSLF